jgi:hypothetical protein
MEEYRPAIKIERKGGIRMKKETSAVVSIGMLLVSTCFNMPLAFADYVVSYASFPPDLPGDVDNSGEVDLVKLMILQPSL